jgi:predicted nucleic acid-binding protein
VIVYFDTSALVALYVSDRCSRAARAARDGSDRIATSLLAYPEALAALSALKRGRGLRPRDHDRAVTRFLEDWNTFHRVRLDSRVLPEARRLLKHYALTGADAVHLASANLMARAFSATGETIRFACDDRRLADAADDDGLELAWRVP